MTSQHDEFDRQARAHYRNAAQTLSPTMQGRLRAARRTALSASDAGQRDADRRQAWPVLPLAAMAAVVFALAICLHWQRGADNRRMSPPGASEAPPVVVETGVDPGNPQHDAGKPDASTTQSPITNVPDTAVSNTDAPETVVPDPVAPDPDARQRVAMEPPASDVSEPTVPTDIDPTLLVLEEDPDFYLWLGGDDAYPADLEPSNDAT